MIVEFYKDAKSSYPMVMVEGIPPPVNALISIRCETWKVIAVTWAVDQPTGERPTLRANVTLEKQ